MTFLEYFNKNVHRVYLVDKKNSRFMRFINWCLSVTNKLGLTSIKNFMTGYGTTIRYTEYDSPGWTWDRELDGHMAHELCHLLLWSLLYAFLYVVSKKKRCYYESVCIQASALCFPDKYLTDSYIERRAEGLTDYGCSEDEARQMMLDRRREIQEGKPHWAAKRVYNVKVSWEAYQNAQGGSV